MCGIAFIYNPAIEGPELEVRMKRCLEALKHRGPDEHGIYQQNGWVAGHRRLSIIDIATSQQPMRDPGGNYLLTFNGEIYNFRELRHDLERDWDFKTQGDTEVILAGLCIFGAEFLQKMQGMWALAFWDEKNKSLLLSRDRTGKKPLYYSEHNKSIACCSELPAFRHLLPRGLTEDLNSTADYFRYGFFLPGFTAYENIREVLPGHYLEFSPDKQLSEVSYWKLGRGLFTGSKQDAIESLKSRFISAVNNRMVSDVEVGAFLSGGVDSSLIVATMVKELGLKPKTFTIGFKNTSYDERKYAKLVADINNTDHHEQILVDHDPEELIELIINHHGQPFGDPSLLPTAMVSRLAAEHVKVVLSGDGGDELFSGYQRYQARILLDIYLKAPRSVRHVIEATLDRFQDPSVHHSRSLLKKAKLFIDSVKRGTEVSQYIAPLMQSTTQSIAFSSTLTHSGHAAPDTGDIANEDDVLKMMFNDVLVYLPQDILAKVDRASMAFSLETRAPFLDTSLIEFCFSLPRKWHRRGISGKRILKETFYSYLPDSIWNRRKQGFAVPLSHWFKNRLGQQLLERLSSVSQTPFNKPYVEQLLHSHKSGFADNSMLLWAIYVYLIWRDTP